jgi:hypothetical protein
MPIPDAGRQVAPALAQAALERVRERETGRVRVEDYLTVLGAMTGEAALLASGVIDIEASDIPPGSPVFGDPQNQVLSGDTTDLTAVPPETVIGILVAELVPSTYAREAFPPLEDLYRLVASGVGTVEWGHVALDTPADNAPSVLPIQVAFELRPAVDAAVEAAGVARDQRHRPCALALAHALREVQGAIDPEIGLRLALEVVFGMAKMAPMSKRAFEAASQPARQPAG